MQSSAGTRSLWVRSFAVACLTLLALAGLALIGWRMNLLGIRTASPLASVGVAFDPPPSYPGYQWTRHGHAVSPQELVSAAGPRSLRLAIGDLPDDWLAAWHSFGDGGAGAPLHP